jgi:hypothetical protein
LQKYKIPTTTVHKVVCNKCGTELENKRPKPQVVIDYPKEMLKAIPMLPIDYSIEDEEISFHCNTCHNEDDFKMITLGSILDNFCCI